MEPIFFFFCFLIISSRNEQNILITNTKTTVMTSVVATTLASLSLLLMRKTIRFSLTFLSHQISYHFLRHHRLIPMHTPPQPKECSNPSMALWSFKSIAQQAERWDPRNFLRGIGPATQDLAQNEKKKKKKKSQKPKWKSQTLSF